MESQQPSPAVCVGIDWADEVHALCLVEVNQPDQPQHRELKQQPEEIDDWANSLRQRYPGQVVAVCLEQSKGALIHALMKYEHLVLYPVNPKQLARFREALSPSGAKDDPDDAELLALLWLHHRDKLRTWRPDDIQTRLLQALVEDRRRLVERRVRLTNALKARLKQYFPLALEMVSRLDSSLACQFLLRFDSLAALQQLKPEELEDFYRAHRCRRSELIKQRVEMVATAVPLTEDAAIVASGKLLVRTLVEQLVAVIEGVARYEVQIKELMQQHPEAEIFTCLPGAGEALAPRLLAAFGTDRQRFDGAQAVQQHSGIAPVTKRSGKQCVVHRRWACNKFLRQTFHEFACHSRSKSPWAKAYYRQQMARGQGHHTALRSLAYKWIRILYRCWKAGTRYNELAYLEQLRKRQSPLLDYLVDPETSRNTPSDS